jgi:hypothetical protein
LRISNFVVRQTTQIPVIEKEAGEEARSEYNVYVAAFASNQAKAWTFNFFDATETG